MRNYYSELPYQPYFRSTVEMGKVVEYIKSLDLPKAVKIATYIIFRMESGNGRSGINNNFVGAQSDSGRWPSELDPYITGWTKRNENMTGKERLFLTFDSFKGSIHFLVNRIQSRGLYVGAYCNVVANMRINDSDDWAQAYYSSWVTGNKNTAIPARERADILSIYRQGEKIF